ncbi:hypothetical protein TcWFU_002197 [Taenia crassiceps]|uniref:Uncharacterized protein n=1 Tax=Taenia crassiceps TaxID=6207 RepID=A0ABR4QLE3_9CEST
MHRMIKHRMNRVLSTAYESGSLAFSKDFLNEFGTIVQKSNKLAANIALPEGILNPLLMAQSDPPRGAFKRKRRTLRVRRQRRPRQTDETVTGSRSSGRHPCDDVPPVPEMSRSSETKVCDQSRSPVSPSMHSTMTLDDLCGCSSCSSSSSSSSLTSTCSSPSPSSSSSDADRI